MGSELGIRTGIRSILRSGDSVGSGTLSSNDLSFIIARVSFVLLDDSNKEKFEKYGGWKSIGLIEAITFLGNNQNTDIIPALPINPNITQFPVVNEIVLLVRAIRYNAQKPPEYYDSEFYYLNIIPGWNAVEHNAIPNADSVKQDISNITGPFKSTGKVNRVIKSPGDMTVEGRSGNYIRLGSSIQGFNSPYKGKDRSPLISIINGQRETESSKIGIFEDINLDGSSLYMLKGQSVGFNVSSLNFDSYKFKISQEAKSNYIQPTIVVNDQPDVLPKMEDPPLPKKEVVNLNTNVEPITDSQNKIDDALLNPDKAYNEEPVFDLTDGDFVDLNTSDYKSEVVEEETSADKNTLLPGNIKWQVQQGGDWCYVAACSMILLSYGISNATQTDIHRSCTDKSGKLLSNKVASRYGVKFSIVMLPDGIEASYNKILEVCKNRNNKPFILQRKGSSDRYPNHFVVVRGAIGKDIYIYDSGSSLNNPKLKNNKNGTTLKKENLLSSKGSLRFFDL